MSTKSLLKEYRRLNGQITESDDTLLLQSVIPGITNALQHCEESLESLKTVLERLEKVAHALRSDSNSLHLPAESSYVSGHLRSALQHILSSEQPIRKAMTALDQLS